MFSSANNMITHNNGSSWIPLANFTSGSSERTVNQTALWPPMIGYIAIPISLIAIVGSIQCIILLWSDKKQHLSAKAVFTSLAVASFVTGVALIVTAYQFIVGTGNPLNTDRNNWFCQISIFVMAGGMKTLPCTHAAIALNRLFYVVLGDWIPAVKSRGSRTLLVVTPWILTIITFTLPFFHVGGSYGFNKSINFCAFTRTDYRFSRFYRIFSTLGSFIIMLVSYTIVLFRVYKSAHRLRHHRVGTTSMSRRDVQTSTPSGLIKRTLGGQASGPAGTSYAQRTTRKAERRAAGKVDHRVTKVALIACTVFLICHVPPTVLSFFASSLAELQGVVGQAMNLLDCFGVAISPWITACATNDMRRRWLSCFKNFVRPFSKSPIRLETILGKAKSDDGTDAP